MPPVTHYAKHGDVSIAYQAVGDGPVDLVMVPGFISHLDLYWTLPEVAAMFRRLASFSRFITFDKPGTGISDPIAHVPTLEERMEDLHAVLDAAGSERAALFGISEGGPMSVLFAATYPERTLALALYGTFPCGTVPDPLPEDFAGIDFGARWERLRADADDMLEHWGEGRMLDIFIPSLAGSDAMRRAVAFFERAAASPRMARGVVEAALKSDVREILPTIRVPTVVIHRTGDCVPVEAARWMAAQIPGARFIELPGIDHTPWHGDMDAVVDEIEELVTGVRREHEPDRALATVLFTDIVDSTRHAAERGDHTWREVLERHDTLVRRELERFRGREVKTTGDGFLAVFDGPARAIRCARAIADATIDEVGLQVRAGVHTGECEIRGDDVGGIAVHIGARVAHIAGPGRVLVSSTVKDLVVGSGLGFVDGGEHDLKGVPGRWRVFAVTSGLDGAESLAARRDPELAVPAIEQLSRGERAQLTMARRAPAVGRAASRLMLRRARRRGEI
jgi:class 3 adenylate cyclase/dienelactone hydrolase